MAKTEIIKIEIEPELMAAAKKILEQLGLSMDAAVTIFLRQIILHGKLPFEIQQNKDNFIRTKYKAGQTVYVNITDTKQPGRKTIKATIDYVGIQRVASEMPRYITQQCRLLKKIHKQYGATESISAIEECVRDCKFDAMEVRKKISFQRA